MWSICLDTQCTADLFSSVTSPPGMNYTIHYLLCNCRTVRVSEIHQTLLYLLAKFNNMIKVAKFFDVTLRTGSLFSGALRNPGVIFGSWGVINICIFLYKNPYWTFTLDITSMWARTTGLLLPLKSSFLDLFVENGL